MRTMITASEGSEMEAMYTSRNPAKSRPLSANVKRLMRLARASPQNRNVVKVGRQFSIRDLAYCNKQGSLFMEAASMGFAMRDFAPLYMTSQIVQMRERSRISLMQTRPRFRISRICRIIIGEKDGE